MNQPKQKLINDCKTRWLKNVLLWILLTAVAILHARRLRFDTTTGPMDYVKCSNLVHNWVLTAR